MFNIYSEALHCLFKFVRKLPKDMALIRVYDYYDGEESHDAKTLVKYLFDGTLDYNFNEPNEDIKETVILFSSTTYAREYEKLYNLCNVKQKQKLNKLSKPLFTFVKNDHNGYFDTEDFAINKKLQNEDVIKVIKELQDTVSKEHVSYTEKLNKKKNNLLTISMLACYNKHAVNSIRKGLKVEV